MSTPRPKSTLDGALAKVPTAYRSRIVRYYLELKARHAEGKLDAAGVSGGKLCESTVRLLQDQLGKTVTPFGQQITNLQAECEAFAQLPKTTGIESLRLVIPRAVSFLYTLRNKRGIGHVGGDVDANAIDGAAMRAKAR